MGTATTPVNHLEWNTKKEPETIDTPVKRMLQGWHHPGFSFQTSNSGAPSTVSPEPDSPSSLLLAVSGAVDLWAVDGCLSNEETAAVTAHLDKKAEGAPAAARKAAGRCLGRRPSAVNWAAERRSSHGRRL
eukprot:CAMPEP_0177786780 /NCGR_PEP_ID=MMETSP0491_2-20121128/21113_1 /TAXON_ID=63592 /ORGANISM="Tetraselmis chuii, Strain PLY429" /LENGTH=130 /DNA_ID=CAMNT_0019308029 /DNA_START=318 /DNA_END=712 /DNA_ORIENTATION=+